MVTVPPEFMQDPRTLIQRCDHQVHAPIIVQVGERRSALEIPGGENPYQRPGDVDERLPSMFSKSVS